MLVSETLLSKLENLLNGLTILGGAKEQTTILPNAIVINDAPSGLADYIIVRDPRDGNYITAVKVAGMAYAINDYVNLLFVKGTEPIAFQHGSNSPGGGFKVYQVWESDLGAVAAEANATGDITFHQSIILDGAVKVIRGTGSNVPDLGTSTAAQRIGNIYIADTKTIDNPGTLNLDATTALVFKIATNEAIRYNATAIIINEDSLDRDLRIEGNGDANLFFIDAGLDRIGIGVATLPAAKVTIDQATGAATSHIRMRDATATRYRADLSMQAGGIFDFTSFDDTGAAYTQLNFNASPVLFQVGDVGIGAVPAARLHVDQSSTTAAIPVLTVDQADVSEEFIRFIGTSANTVLTQSIVDAADVASTTLVGWLKFYVQDDGNQIPDGTYYMPFYSIA